MGLLVHAVLAALGVGAPVAASPTLYEVLRWAGVPFMLWLAWDGWRDAEADEQVPHGPATAAQLMLRGFVTNALNPKSILFFVALVPGFLVPGAEPMLQLAVLGAVYIGIATTVHAAIVTLAAGLRPWLLQGPRWPLVRRGLSGAAGGGGALARLVDGALNEGRFAMGQSGLGALSIASA